MKNNKAFTLIELMVAIAIVGILAAVVMVQMSSYGKKARASRAMAQASSVIPSMMSCWGNTGDVKTPSTNKGGGDICSLGSGYGQWPDTTAINYVYAGTPTTKVSPWSFTVIGDSITICCNSAMNSCGQPASCNATAVW